MRKVFSRKAPAWAKVCRSLLLVATALAGVNHVLLPNAPGRPLTPEETTMLRDVFKDSVDYNKIRIHHSSVANRVLGVMGAEAIAHKNRIFVRNNRCQDNYGTCGDDFNVYPFVHEAAHVWQSQNGLMPGMLRQIFDNYTRVVPNGGYHKHYEYDLKDPRPLTGYNVEQQASIITDYHLYARHGQGQKIDLYINAPKDPAAIKADYDRKLADFNRNPAYPRHP